MKTLSYHWLRRSVAALSCAWCVSSFAQVAVTESTTSYAGTVAQFEPVNQTLVVRQEASPTPMTYGLTQATTFVDESGAPVLAEQITAGVPITVHYVRHGDQMLASRVVVRKVISTPTAVSVPAPSVVTVREPSVVTVPVPVERTTTVTTTTEGTGTITRYVPGEPAIVLRSEASPEPLSYSVTKTTTFVDDTGAPVAVERIAPGLPVTVHYVREGERMVASRVVVVREPRREVQEIRETREIRKIRDTDDDDDDN